MNESKLNNILTIVAYIVDGNNNNILLKQKEYIVSFVSKKYGSGIVNECMVILSNIFDQKKMLESNGREDVIYQKLRDAAFLLSNGTYENRMGLLAFYIGLSIEAEHIDIDKLHNVAMILSLEEEEVDIILEMINPHNEESPKERALRILELPFNATEDEIKETFRRLSLKYHPERNLDKSISEQKEAERKFKEIVAAKEILDETI